MELIAQYELSSDLNGKMIDLLKDKIQQNHNLNGTNNGPQAEKAFNEIVLLNKEIEDLETTQKTLKKYGFIK